MSTRTVAQRSSAAAAALPELSTLSGAETWETDVTNENCMRPLPGRETEYEAVVAFVDARLHTVVHHNSLFVFGACGCGKTSTVLRALRSFTRRCLPSDKQRKPSRPATATAKPTNSGSRRTRLREDDEVVAVVGASTRLTSLSRAVKRTKLETSPGASSGASAARGSVDTSPASSAGHARSSTGSAHTGGRLSGDSTVSSHDEGRALFPSKSSSTDLASTDNDNEDQDSGEGAVVAAYSPEYFASRYKRLYEQRTAPASAGSKKSGPGSLQPVQAHYVNCADLGAAQLTEALCQSIKSTTPRPDAATRTLLNAISALPETDRRPTTAAVRMSASATTTAAAANAHKSTLHVIALDEVEYVRGAAARDVLSGLGSLSFTHPTQIALIFISNHRDLVHVPRVLLEELPFEPYTIAELKDIGSRVVQYEVSAAAQRETAEAEAALLAAKLSQPPSARGRRRAASTQDTPPSVSASALVQISPTLLEYIARKALLDYSGDVRQVMAMCRRVTYTALEEIHATATTNAAAAAAAAKTAHKAPASLAAALEAAVATFQGAATSRSGRGSAAATSSGVSSTRSSGAHVSTTDVSGRSSGSGTEAGAGAAAPSPTPTPTPTPRRGPHMLTLANTVSLLNAGAVETQVQKHISTMPEQQLYVLCCLLVLTLRHQRDAGRAAVAIGGVASNRGRGGGGGATRTASLSVTMRDVHQLYMGLMGLRHYPAMNAAGITTAVDGLADLGIITRPQRRGNDQVFTFNGTWSLDAMQGALENRGEALRQELASCGLDASENKFTTVLRELKNLAGLESFA